MHYKVCRRCMSRSLRAKLLWKRAYITVKRKLNKKNEMISFLFNNKLSNEEVDQSAFFLDEDGKRIYIFVYI